MHPKVTVPRLLLVALFFVLGAALAWQAVALVGSPGDVERVSVSTDGDEADDISYTPAVSADGRYVAFVSAAGNLVPGDTNGVEDVFVHDRQTGRTERVSIASNGVEADDASDFAAISADGRYVAFGSAASTLVPGDTNFTWDVFVRDRQTGTTTRVSVDSAGVEGDDESGEPSISADGRLVAFSSWATNLVPGDTNNYADVFVHDRDTGDTTRVSVSTGGAEANDLSYEPALSADGRYVAYTSYADTLVAGDTNETADVLVHDLQTGATARVSVDAGGAEGDGASFFPTLSADGRYAAFSSEANNLVPVDTNNQGDVFVHDRQSGRTYRVSVSSTGEEGNSGSYLPALSADGRYVAFESYADNLVTGDTNEVSDVFVHDRDTGETTRVSVDGSGAEGDDESDESAISADARFVAYSSLATNLVADDTNDAWDIFVYTLDLDGAEPGGQSFVPVVMGE